MGLKLPTSTGCWGFQASTVVSYVFYVQSNIGKMIQFDEHIFQLGGLTTKQLWIDMGMFQEIRDSQKSPAGPTERTVKKPEYVIARSQHGRLVGKYCFAPWRTVGNIFCFVHIEDGLTKSIMPCVYIYIYIHMCILYADRVTRR